MAYRLTILKLYRRFEFGTEFSQFRTESVQFGTEFNIDA